MTATDAEVLEEVRAFWDRRPCNIRHSPQPVGTLTYFEEVSARRYHVEPHIAEFADFPHWHRRLVLEVGCGIGTDLAEFVRHRAQVIGLELSPESAKLARRRLEVTEYGTRLGRVVVHNVEDAIRGWHPPVLDWPHAPTGTPPDLIYSMGVLHHTPRPDRALRHLFDISDRRTELRIMLYHRWSTKVLAVWRGPIARRSEAQRGSPVTWTYSRRGARRLLETNGWAVQSIKVRHIFPYRVRDYVQHRCVKRFPWNLIPTRPLDRLLGWHLLIVARPRL